MPSLPNAKKKSSIVLLTTVFFSFVCVSCVHKKHAPTFEPFRRAYPIMGTVFTISMWDRSGNEAEIAAKEAHQAVVNVDLAASNYRGDSELENIHRKPRDQEISLSPLLHELLSASLEISEKTDGLLDVTVSPLVELWKLARPVHGEEQPIPTEAAIAKVKENVGYRKLGLTPKKLYLPEGMKLDFGATGKGFALDQAAKVLRKSGVQSASLSLGNQWLFIGKPPGEKCWKVDIRNPESLTESATTLEVPEGSVSTSAAYARYFTHQGKRYGHIINPKTGWPSEQTTSVTVWAKTGIEADGYSTAMFIAGPEAGRLINKRLRNFSPVWLNKANNKKYNWCLSSKP